MAKPPEYVTFLLANLALFIISVLLTGLTYFAYRRSDGRSSYRLATIGFGSIVLGGAVEPVYLLVTPGDSFLNTSELMFLQTGEGILIALGLGLIFYGIIAHEPGSTDRSDRHPTAPETGSEQDDWDVTD